MTCNPVYGCTIEGYDSYNETATTYDGGSCYNDDDDDDDGGGGCNNTGCTSEPTNEEYAIDYDPSISPNCSVPCKYIGEFVGDIIALKTEAWWSYIELAGGPEFPGTLTTTIFQNQTSENRGRRHGRSR